MAERIICSASIESERCLGDECPLLRYKPLITERKTLEKFVEGKTDYCCWDKSS